MNTVLDVIKIRVFTSLEYALLPLDGTTMSKTLGLFNMSCSFGEWSSSKSQKPLLQSLWSQMCLTAVVRKR